MKQVLAGVRDWFYRQKFYFENGLKFLTIVNFLLLLLAVSDKLKMFGIPRWGVYALVPIGFFCIWLFGKVMVDIAKGYAKEELEGLSRSPAWKMHQENFKRSEKILQLLEENHNGKES